MDLIEILKNLVEQIEIAKGGPGSGPNPGQRNRAGTGKNIGEITLYHGTLLPSAKKMLTEGIKNGKIKNWSTEFYKGGRINKVFATSSYNEAGQYSYVPADGKNVTPVILTIKMPKDVFKETMSKDSRDKKAFMFDSIDSKYIKSIQHADTDKILYQAKFNGDDYIIIYISSSEDAINDFLNEQTQGIK